MPDGDMVERNIGPDPLPNGEVTRSHYPTEARSLLAPRSLVSQIIEVQPKVDPIVNTVKRQNLD